MTDAMGDTQETPQRLGKYVIQSVLGRGGMGVVYKAHDPSMNRHVAIKTVTDGFTSDGTMLKRFYREAEKTGRLTHPNIIIIYELGDDGGHPYIVMEYVEGRTLESILKDAKNIPILHKLRIIEQVCAALGYAHANGVIHRDVKPANVIVRPDGIAKLLDFGIAVQDKKTDHSLTKTGSIIGTVAYMAPERLYGSEIDGRSDIFAVGVMLYQLLTGSLPFAGEEMTIINKILNEPYSPLRVHLPDYPQGLEAVIDRSLQKLPADRYSVAEEMAGELYPVIELVKGQHIEMLLADAQRQLEADQPMAARESYLEILKLDNQQRDARRLLTQLQNQISRKQREDHAAVKRQQAELAMQERDYETAFTLLSDASKLLPMDAGIAQELEKVRQKKQVSAQVAVYLQQANDAKRSGNISAARAMVQQALDLDATNSRVRLALNALAREAQVAEQQHEARKLLHAARELIVAKDFEAALVRIRQAETLDPTSVEVTALMSRAKDGQQRELRRGLLEEVERQVAAADTEAGCAIAARTIDEALERLPNDAILDRFKLQLDQQLRGLQVRKLVEDTIYQCRVLAESSPAQALEKVRATLSVLPAEERLLALAATFEEQMARQELDATRSGYLARAREALADQDYAHAVKILEECQRDCYSSEVGELLESARKSEGEQRKSQLIAACYPKARALLQDEDYEGAVSALEAVLRTEHDQGLQRMLDESRAALQERALKRESFVETIERLTAGGHSWQALLAISAAAPEFSSLPEVERMRSTCEAKVEERRMQLLRIGRGYAALASTHPDRDWVDGPGAGAADSQVLTALWKHLEVRRRTTAEGAVHRCIEEIGECAEKKKAELAASVKHGRIYLSFVSKEIRGAWRDAIWRRLRSMVFRWS